MGCLKVISLLLNKVFSVKTFLQNRDFIVKAFLQNRDFSVKTFLQNRDFSVNVVCTNDFKVECSLVCSVSITPILVVPREMQWITVETPIIYNIVTKQSWIII